MIHSFVIVAVLLTASTVALAHGVTMKLRHPLPADSAFHRLFVIPWTEKVHRDAGGRISFQVQAGDPAPGKLIDALMDADADVVWTAIASAPGRLPALESFELPLLTKDAMGASRALIDYVRLSDAAQSQLDGARLIAAHQVGTAVFHMRGKPVTHAEDLKGLKVGAATPAARMFLSRAGATPVDIALTGIADPLSSDLDGALLSWDLVPASATAAKFHSEPGAARLDAPVFVLLLNAGTYNGLPDDLKKVIQDNSGADTAAVMVRAFENGGQAARKAASGQGAAINAIPTDEIAKWQPAAQATIQDWLDAPGKRGRKQALETAREALGH